MKSNVKILLSPTQDVLTAELEPANLFRVLDALKKGLFQPQVSFFDQSTQEWTRWQTTETVPTESLKRKAA